MAFFEEILNGLTQPAPTRPAFGSLAVKPPAATPVAPLAPVPGQRMAQPGQRMAQTAPASSGFEDMATFLAGMGDGGGALLPALGAGARAVTMESKRREAVNQTRDFLLRNGVSPEDAEATLANPDLLKLKLGQMFKPAPQAPAGFAMRPDGTMAFVPGGPEDPATIEAQSKARAMSKPAPKTLDDLAAERGALADKLGLQGDLRKHYIATGDMPRTAPPQEMREYQTKDAMWAERLMRAEKQLDAVAGIDPQTGKPAKGAYNPAQNSNAWWPDDTYGANLFNSSEWQQYQQAAREGIAAILRKDTGAAVTQAEWDLYFPMLYPQPGDSPEVVAQKKASREANARALRASSGAAFNKMFPDYEAGGQPAQPTQNNTAAKPDPLGIR